MRAETSELTRPAPAGMHGHVRKQPGANKALLSAGWRFPGARVLASRRPIVLLYHSVPARGPGDAVNAAVFERHIRFLARRFQIVPAQNVREPRKATSRIQVAITFDDGFRNNAEVAAPIMRKVGVPATFFVNSRNTASDDVIWPTYFAALKQYFPERSFSFRGERFDMTAARREQSMHKLWHALLALRPHPHAIYDAVRDELPALDDFVSASVYRDECAAMTEEHLRDLARDSLFTIGVHTVDHPFLSLCSPEQMRQQIADNRRWIESVTGRHCEDVAYPSGDYNADVLGLCRELGFQRGFAVTPKVGQDAEFEIARLGVYSPSPEVLGFKVQWGHLLRSLRLPIG